MSEPCHFASCAFAEAFEGGVTLSEWDSRLLNMLRSLVSFQVRAFKRCPQKQRRRVIFGMRECARSSKLQSGKDALRTLILARDIDPRLLQQEHPELAEFYCLNWQDPRKIMVGGNMLELGRLAGSRGQVVTAVGILSIDGAADEFSWLLEAYQAATVRYESRFRPSWLWFSAFYGRMTQLTFHRSSEKCDQFVNAGATPLLATVAGLGNVQTVGFLLSVSDATIVDFGLNSIVHLATCRPQILAYLIEEQPQLVDTLLLKRNADGWTPMHMAVAIPSSFTLLCPFYQKHSIRTIIMDSELAVLASQQTQSQSLHILLDIIDCYSPCEQVAVADAAFLASVRGGRLEAVLCCLQSGLIRSCTCEYALDHVLNDNVNLPMLRNLIRKHALK